MKWNIFLLVSVLLFSLCSPLFSEVVLTDQEYETILNELTNLENLLNSKEQKINELQTQLETAEKELQTVETELNTVEKSLKISNEITTMQDNRLELLEKSLNAQKKDQILNDLKYFGLGFGTGFITGNYTGFQIGISIRVQI